MSSFRGFAGYMEVGRRAARLPPRAEADDTRRGSHGRSSAEHLPPRRPHAGFSGAMSALGRQPGGLRPHLGQSTARRPMPSDLALAISLISPHRAAIHLPSGHPMPGAGGGRGCRIGPGRAARR